ncbi:hypothetical protein ALC57_15440 [Trachymyrmex cornetzi]|uniref:Uncharacterized protein n=1 Tax=Trachymyrmex cornetzi TaxID=471704 RepID=A0A151IX95_9HYME|nr:hypothetical protein ALC57_15440 [Trachymyrmex cornetzi]
MNSEYADYPCSACKKPIKSKVVKCGSCVKLFYYPGCVVKYKIYDRNQKLVPCAGPFEEFLLESDQEAKRTPTVAGNNRDRTESTGSVGITGLSSIDMKIDWLIRTVKEIKNGTACKREIKMMIKEVVREELKQELEDLRKMILGVTCESMDGLQRSYSEAVKEKKKENIIIVKPKMQQESETTKTLIKEKADIQSISMGIMKLRKGINGTVIMGYETGKEVKRLKETVQAKLGENYNVKEPQSRSKIKILILTWKK